jgi:thiol-disulfide isomerase/thioredoxin
MKKTVLILVAVVVVVMATYFADKVTRVKPRNGVPEMNSSAVKPAPDFTLKNVEDQEVSLDQFKGKVVLVNFWATWCEPCQVEIPWLIEMQQKYAGKGFTVLGVAMDEEGKSVVAPWVQKEHFKVGDQSLAMNYPILLGNDNVASKFGGLLGYPTSVLISRDGKQVRRITGLLSYDEIQKAIESQL